MLRFGKRLEEITLESGCFVVGLININQIRENASYRDATIAYGSVIDPVHTQSRRNIRMLLDLKISEAVQKKQRVNTKSYLMR